MTKLTLTQRQYLDLEKLSLGAFAPLGGFMREEEFLSVVERMRLPDGNPFPLPVVLDVSAEQARALRGGQSIRLDFQGLEVGEVVPESVYTCHKASVAAKLFGTDDPRHPGVAYFSQMGDWFIGGTVRLLKRVSFDFSAYELTPAEAQAHCRSHGWKTMAGFQTRNVPHRAHEYLQRLALTLVDGLFIQPLVGWKKRGDYHPMAILTAYRTLIDQFLPSERVLLGALSTYMRYAGPREAVFHAIIRRNYGCTHFIVGRDHAGVNGYYGKYEAQDLVRHFAGELGIEVFCFPGPFYCRRCDGIVTERTCPHVATAPEDIQEISGTMIRRLLVGQEPVAPQFMRPEVVANLAGIPLFIEEDSA